MVALLRRKSAAFAAILVVSAACADDRIVNPSSQSEAVQFAREAEAEVRAAEGGRLARGFEEHLLRIEGQLPGFGGLFIDTLTGLPTAYLRPGTDPKEARTRTLAILSAPGRANLSGLRARIEAVPALAVREGSYSFSELVIYKRRVAKALAGRYTVALDADESLNRVRIEIRDLSAADDLMRTLTDAGIPSDVVKLEQGTSIAKTATLRDNIRPLAGGVQIKNTSNGVCTHGFNVDVQIYGDRGFLTAAHCNASALGNGNTGKWIYQHIYSWNTFVGEVKLNPAFNLSDPDCEGAILCTRADVMFVDGLLSSTQHAKRVVGNTFWGANNALGVIGINAQWSGLGIGLAYEGSPAYKVGRTTGGTVGTVTNTCVDVPVPTGVGNSNYYVLCSTEVSGSAVGEGDSGAPVFLPSDINGSQPMALGILYAGAPLDPPEICSAPLQCRYFYSDWFNIESHLSRYLLP